jgi:hypothetical protein
MNESTVVIIGIIGFILFWYIITKTIGHLAGFVKDLETDLSDDVDRISFASMSMRKGMFSGNYGGVLTIIRKSTGYRIELMWIFGGGVKILNDHEIAYAGDQKTFWLGNSVEIHKGTEVYKFHGKAAEFMRKYRPTVA